MAAQSGAGRLTLIQQNDIHAQLDEHWELFWASGRERYHRMGGLARAASVVQAIRRERADAAILVDCGDAIHGSYAAQQSAGQAVVPALNALGVEMMAPGNWEYGYGPAALWARAAEMAFPLIACNLQHAESGERPFEPYLLRELGGLRVGFVGLTSPIVPKMDPTYAAGLRFPAPQESLPRCITKLREQEGADLVVAVSHLGFPQDVALAREIGGLDVILSGHTHNRLTEPARVGGTHIIQSGFSGSFLGRLDLEVVRGTIVDVRHALIPLDEGIEPDPGVAAVVAEALAPFRAAMAEVVGETQVGLHRMGLMETTMDNLITAAYQAATGADVAISHGWRYGPPVPPGPITAGDLWAMIPTNPELFVGELSGQELLTMLEENLYHVLAGDPFEQAGGYFLRLAGVSVVFRPNNPRGTRIEQVEIGGAPLDRGRRYRVAVGGQRNGRLLRERQSTGQYAIPLLCEYLATQSPVAPVLTHRTFIAQ